MKRLIIINGFIILLFCSCEFASNKKNVEVIIKEQHPFETVCSKELWYTLYWLDGNKINYYHLPVGVKKVNILVSKDKSIYFCAKLLDSFTPLGGVISPGIQNKIELKFEQGYLVDFLFDVSKQNKAALSVLNYSLLYQRLKTEKKLHSFDKLTLARSIINGELDLNKIYSYPQIKVNLDQVFKGYWISDYPREGGFYKSSNSNNKLYLSLGEGEHNYFNYDMGYIFKVIVDTRNKKYFINMKECNIELKKLLNKNI